jgi:NDP-sugar pyrophosphorylase family protein
LEVLTEHGLSDNDISLVKFSGINIIKGKIKVNPGAVIVNSCISNGAILGHDVVVTHSIIGENVHIYPNSIVPYAIVGKGTRIGANVVLARERLRGELEKRYSVVHKFLAEKRMVLYSTKFSALVGENSKLMINVSVHPGRRIGHHVTVFPKLNVFYNLPPFYKMIDENRFEFDQEEYQRYGRDWTHVY